MQVKILVDDRTLRDRRCESRIGMRSRFFIRGRPVVALPVDRVLWRTAVDAFPPDIAVVGQRNICKDRIFAHRLHGVWIGLVVGAGRDAEKAGFRIDRVKFAVFIRFDPGDVVTDGGYLPSFILKRLWRNEHREICFSARRRKSRANIILPAVGRFYADDKHMLR